jgi:hypothetical protein
MQAEKAGVTAHLSDDETVVKMGHPVLWLVLDMGHPPNQVLSLA